MEDVTNEFIFQVIEILSLIFVKKISYSVGSEKLKKTYQAVLEECDTKSIGVIDIAIKLDHFRHIPQREIANMYVSAPPTSLHTSFIRRIFIIRKFSIENI